jgi:hypothetical protein
MDERRAKWNANLKELKELCKSPERFDEFKSLFFELHYMVHERSVSGIEAITFEDEVWRGLTREAFITMPTIKDDTIAWDIWHSTRIEDITINILVAGENQLLYSEGWYDKLNVKAKDTGNIMTDEEIIELSENIDMTQLRNYRAAVARKTRVRVSNLQFTDLKRRMEPKQLQRIFDEGAVLNKEGASGLVDFWGKKTVAGLLFMPATRHHLVHINDCVRLKAKIASKR